MTIHKQRKKALAAWALALALALMLCGCKGTAGAQSPETSAQSPETSAQPQDAPGETLSVHFIDVGQGDCILVRGPEADVLIDGGPTESADSTVAYLAGEGVGQLDAVINSHSHIDHYGGLRRIIKALGAKEFIMPDIPAEVQSTAISFEKLVSAIDDMGITAVRAQQGDTIDLGGGGTLTVLWAGQYDNLNDCSAVCRVDFGESSFLFTGDIGAGVEDDMINAGVRLEADVLKAPHHGSSSSSTGRFLEAVSPEYAVIMCGAGNDYGHPHRETLELYNRLGLEIYRTDTDGTVVFTTDGKNITVTAKGKE